jgi:hypothetical protein
MFSLSLGNSSSKGLDYTTGQTAVLQIMRYKATNRIALATALLILLFVFGCSTLQPPDPNGPRSNAPPYPVVVLDETTKQEDALLAWRQLAQRYLVSSAAEIVLDPLTGTVKALPANLSGPVLLPKVGVGVTQTEEEIRESLRRFITEWRSLIGAEPNELSLVERIDESPNVKVARYEQRPFRYALRGGYGKLLIRFNSSRQVIELSSNCLRNTDRLQSAMANLTPKISAEDAVSHIRGKSFNLPIASGQQQIFSLGANEVAEATELVIYAIPSRSQPNVLELRLAWEIATPDAAVKKVYLDAVSDEVIAASMSDAL